VADLLDVAGEILVGRGSPERSAGLDLSDTPSGGAGVKMEARKLG